MRIHRALPLALAATLLAAVPAAATTLPAAIAYVGTASSNNPHVRPPAIIYSGDSSHFFAGARSTRAKIAWSSWTATSATGSGDNWIDNCTPSCANGKFFGTRVKLQLSAPKVIGHHLIFSKLKITYAAGRPRTQTWTATDEGGIYNWI